jgi:hypothetical protein
MSRYAMLSTKGGNGGSSGGADGGDGSMAILCRIPLILAPEWIVTSFTPLFDRYYYILKQPVI